MEKCTYCIQRIAAATDRRPRSRAAPIRDGEVVTACQQACPTQAIIFGNSPTRRARSAEAAASPRNYALLDGASTRPRTTYLARIDATRSGDGEQDGPTSPATRRSRDITDEVARVPLHMPARVPWLIALILSLALLSLFLVSVTDAVRARRRRLGQQHPGQLGLRDLQLHLVARASATPAR